jgi:protein-tyrosine phosphatase
MILVALLLGIAGGAAPVAAAPVEQSVVQSPVMPQRVLGLRGAANFRDIGGYRTANGQSVRWGVVYRSNSLSGLTPADMARVQSLGLQSLIDFRTQTERQAAPDRWAERPAFVYESDKASPASSVGPIFAQAKTSADAKAAVAEFYTRMPDIYRREYAALFTELAKGGEPLVMHCTAGKDRTGVATALLLSVLGVPRDTVVTDYTLTAKLLPTPPASLPGSGKTFSTLTPEACAALWDADPSYINAALDSVDKEYGSVDNYVTRGLGLGPDQLAAIRHNLLN